MFVCLCTGATSHVVNEVIAAGAATSKQVADACGAGADCGRCKRTIRAILAAHRVDGCTTQFNGCPARTPGANRLCSENIKSSQNAP
ncbi:BFD/(2Fe-2S)-binding domain-containing protein [Mycolicibacterium mageritense DSM 44476 = CIP 104973]|uniref:Bacterioferritin-associated ferredoxin n=1 Tax=Mycolicibacterium mageritense TaxID=53462 RepID=A0AAI8TW72_MYCME|nr:(2Fe-2S)-binding protein [Mycolicibacterium mageritense]MBN3454670.1 (2Fe-2S)-binding protein [Mycobacterium sp. DSM 3803]OKH72880.1 (2Fe-2S)-binding protein [Mycobacterium sp. SWH-M3]MCC9184889.1 (2Fe-2S)-binding protein [Mycolicibacterium mageritense]TXI56720.1 MAG: (2Fe-2S)-binding protein [Mycolicibacterium mageritense]CDO26022.1 BFD/(2Fe-2S)-binding domain-containing protein [Mycolicibacterium mageritense DSM 44476 = CIP 104973]